MEKTHTWSNNAVHALCKGDEEGIVAIEAPPCDDVDNMLDNTCEVLRQQTALFSTPETDYIIYD